MVGGRWKESTSKATWRRVYGGEGGREGGREGGEGRAGDEGGEEKGGGKCDEYGYDHLVCMCESCGGPCLGTYDLEIRSLPSFLPLLCLSSSLLT